MTLMSDIFHLGAYLRPFGFVILCCVNVLVLGCSLSTTTQYRDQEGAFSGSLIEKIKPHQTSEDWLFKHFGTPSSTVQTAAGDNLHTWSFVQEQQKHKRILFVFESTKNYQEPRYLHALLSQQQVGAAWVDETHQPNAKALQQALKDAEPVEMYDPSLESIPGTLLQDRKAQASKTSATLQQKPQRGDASLQPTYVVELSEQEVVFEPKANVVEKTESPLAEPRLESVTPPPADQQMGAEIEEKEKALEAIMAEDDAAEKTIPTAPLKANPGDDGTVNTPAIDSPSISERETAKE